MASRASMLLLIRTRPRIDNNPHAATTELDFGD